ncbi:MAG: S9 family peptidase [Candidatus Marinimicrobia bacterium]|nr:S9 family peptidase [Candidatus Neomarinimicrobiota bacterium]
MVLVIVSLFIINPMIQNNESKKMSIPAKAKKMPTNVTVHQDERIDNYAWLREKSSPDVLDYLKAENKYTKANMLHTQSVQNRLFREMKRRLKENDSTAPHKWKDYWYYSRTEKNKQYSIFVRKRETLDAKEEVTLDVNEFTADHDYVFLSGYKISPDQRMLAYTIDFDGSENYILKVKNLKSNQHLGDKLTGLAESVEWANDNKTLFYVTRDEASRPYQLWRHTLGTTQSEDYLVYEEKDESFHMELKRSKSGQFLFLMLGSNVTSECWVLNRDLPNHEFTLIQKRREGIEYEPTHQGNRFLILTNDQSLNFKLVSAPINNPGVENWEDVIPHRPAVKLEEVESFENHIAVFERIDGNVNINIYTPDFQKPSTVELPDSLYEVGADYNLEYKTQALRLYFTSFTIPYSYYDYLMNDKDLILIKRDPVIGGYNPDKYETRRLFAKAHDGKNIPLSLFYKKGIKLDGNNPVYLDGYGSYGATYDPAFSSRRLSLVDRGIVYARAHIRGSSFLGRGWYDDGKLENKQNTFSDFISSAEYLISEKYTSSNKIVIYGGSAGGLLIGAVINQKPKLFKAAIADVPFVDVVNTMLDESIPLTVIEYEEWGNPNKIKDYKHMISYSPYDNVIEQDYPALLVIAGLNDPRVGYWEPAKWVAKLREKKTDDHLLMLKTHMGAGHFSSSGRYDYLKDVAFYYAFALDQLGINK